ncbi:MAG: hypothetical protein ABI977_26615, partial [Acidobacteriota bacterium]
MRAMKLLLPGILLLGVAQALALVRQTENSKSKVLAKILAQSQQLILVTTKDWNVVDGELLRYERVVNERVPTQQIWRPVGEKVAVVVGRSGMAWGRGLHGEPQVLAKSGDPIKKEGDGRSPAGAFMLNSAFGYAPLEQAVKIKLPYLQATATVECVDDPRSTNYNRIVEREKVASPDWKSSEQMLRNDELYRWGVVVDHNAIKPEAGAGSCIFLHIWSGMGKGTAGCTAMEAVKM